MTTEQMNREVAEWLGICWHEPIEKRETSVGLLVKCSCGKVDFGDCCEANPDFSQGAGIIRLLKEMMIDPSEIFVSRIGVYWKNPEKYLIDYSCITTPGKLLEAVHEWSKEHPNGKIS